MAHGDIPEICAIEDAEPSAWNRDQVGEELDLPQSMQLVASLEDRVIGWCCARHLKDEAELMKISVTPEHRRQEVSTRMLECLEIQLLGTGVKRLFLDVRLHNRAAISFYRQAGFTEISRRIRYYSLPEDDALVYAKVIG